MSFCHKPSKRQKNGISNGSRRGEAESLSVSEGNPTRSEQSHFLRKCKKYSVKRKSSGGTNLFAKAGTCFLQGLRNGI